MTERMVRKAKEYDRDTIPGDYATLQSPPNCGGVVKENYRRYACTGAARPAPRLRLLVHKSPAGAPLKTAEAEQLLRERRIGPLEGFRSKAGWPFTLNRHRAATTTGRHNFKLEFDFGDDKNAEESGELVDFAGQTSLGACPICGSEVHEHGSNYVQQGRAHRRAAHAELHLQERQVILQQPVEREQMPSCWPTGKTDLLDKFVSMRTRRNFKAHLAWDKEAGKVNFEFAPASSTPVNLPRPLLQNRAAAKAGQAAAAKKPCKEAAAKTTAAKARARPPQAEAPAPPWPP